MNCRIIATAACVATVTLHACRDAAPERPDIVVPADTGSGITRESISREGITGERITGEGITGEGITGEGITGEGTVTRVMAQVNVESIALARDDGDGKPGEVVTVFAPTDNPLHSIIRLSGVEKGTKVRAVWTAVDAGGERDFEIASQDLTAEIQGNSADFKVSLPRPWPVGRYKVDVYLNDVLTRSHGFEVRGL